MKFAVGFFGPGWCCLRALAVYTLPMSEPRARPVRVRTFHPDDQECSWKKPSSNGGALGASAAWNAIYDMLGWWFAARGLDPERNGLNEPTSSFIRSRGSPARRPPMRAKSSSTWKTSSPRSWPLGGLNTLWMLPSSRRLLNLNGSNSRRSKGPAPPQLKPGRSRQGRESRAPKPDHGGRGPEFEC